MTPEPVYSFVVEDTKGDSFELEIAAADERAKQHFQSVWQRLSLAMEGFHKIEKEPLPGWAEWQPWKWYDERREAYQPRQKYVAWCGNVVVGILNVWAEFSSIHQPGTKTLYIEHLGAAPGNIDTKLWNRRFFGVGTALLGYAMKMSQDQGFEGRLTLHASDTEALGFYRRIDTKMGGNLFYPEQLGILGPTPHASRGDATKTFLETRQVKARQLLEVYRV
ncbi:MAG: GNAT family N-acetyltransferase [Fimbriiglobus sp.]